ncbi:hypothetical protein [Mesorhizobium sp. AR10]|uniref:hypothetical protein n=1 Tax=Mesorhizobium sp. AR10 TaxID=2865839 RepID=UPI00215FA066|nr:hypothetical protein [Mesorhizobium sp. AR10]
MLAALQRLRWRVGALVGGFEAGYANRRLRGFQPSRAHLNTLIAAAGSDITAWARDSWQGGNPLPSLTARNVL